MASCDRAYDQSWHPKTDGTINRGGGAVAQMVECRTRNRETRVLLLLLLPILCRAASSAALSHTGGFFLEADLEWEVESTTVTHSSADWWDLLLPLA